MTYDVKFTGRAEENYRQACEWYAERSPEAAENWYEGMQAALDSLKHDPEHCPLADENSSFPIELRQLNFGSGRRITHRVLFQGHRVNHTREVRDDLLKLIERAWKRFPRKINGKPRHATSP
jgi:plasmid stabilization system protein ParE